MNCYHLKLLPKRPTEHYTGALSVIRGQAFVFEASAFIRYTVASYYCSGLLTVSAESKRY